MEKKKCLNQIKSRKLVKPKTVLRDTVTKHEVTAFAPDILVTTHFHVVLWSARSDLISTPYVPRPSAIRRYNVPSFTTPLSLYHPTLLGHGGTSTGNVLEYKRFNNPHASSTKIYFIVRNSLAIYNFFFFQNFLLVYLDIPNTKRCPLYRTRLLSRSRISEAVHKVRDWKIQ